MYEINPSYAALGPWVARLDETFAHEGSVIHDGRNQLRLIRVDGRPLVVKRYRVPIAINRFAYAHLRVSKCRRAYRNSAELLRRGFSTPEPVAWVECRHHGLLGYSYYVSAQCTYSHNLYPLGRADADTAAPLIDAVGRFTACLHEAGVLHLDYSPGNILYDEAAPGAFRFALVDTNRMRFSAHAVPMAAGCANLARLWGSRATFCRLAAAYAAARGLDAPTCERLMLEARRRFWTRFARHHTVKFPLEL